MGDRPGSPCARMWAKADNIMLSWAGLCQLVSEPMTTLFPVGESVRTWSGRHP